MGALVFELALIVISLVAAVWAVSAYQKKRRRAQLIEKYSDDQIVDNIMNKMIWQGMSDEQLLDSWGSPAARDQKIYKTKITETYKYNQTGRNRFGSRVKVENGIVVGWEQK